MLKDWGVDVYLRVSMQYGFALEVESIIDNYDKRYSEVIRGYFVDEPPADLSDRRVTELILKMKSLTSANRVAIAVHESEWTMKLLTHPNENLRADILVVFDAGYARWSQACAPRFGSGPYCKKQRQFKSRFEIGNMTRNHVTFELSYVSNYINKV